MLALLGSPLLGPAVWESTAVVLTAAGHRCVLAGQPRARGVRTVTDALDAFEADLPDDDLVLVVHSNAGLYVPALAARRRVLGTVFVDAALPPRDPSSDSAPTAPPAFLAFLTERADADGLLPRWTEWWEEEDLGTLFGTAQQRVRIEQQQPRLPLSYFQEQVPVPPWSRLACGYLAFGDTYAAETATARSAGWPVETMTGDHLEMTVHPEEVAAAVLRLMAATHAMS